MCKLCLYIMLSYDYLSNLVVIRPCHASTSSMEASTSRPSFENNDQWPKFGNSHCIQLCNLELIQAWKVGRIRACENRMEKGQMNFSWQSETLKGWICSVPAHLPQRTATHGVLLTSVDICWHLLTSVDICWPYGRSTYYERITKVSVGFLCPALLIQRHQGGTTIRKSGTAKQHLIWPRHPRPQRIVAS